jgi:cytosine/adenosine deaminase-related metal-dependent hydrolase
MATRQGAKVARLDDVGELRPGCKADVVMLRLDDTSMGPVFDRHSYIGLLVYSAGRHLVDSVWVDGKRVVSDGEICTVDEEAIRQKAQEAAVSVARRLEG